MAGLARFAVTRRKTMVALWLVLLVGVVGAWQTVGSHYSTNFTLGNTGAQKASDLLKASFQGQSGDSDQIVFHTLTGKLTAGASRSHVEATLAQVAKLPHVAGVVSPYAAGGARQISSDGTIGFATVQFDETAPELPHAAINKVISVAESGRSARLEVDLGGAAIEQVVRTPPSSLTGIGIGAAVIVLLVTFGSFTAMSLPIVSALLGLGVGLGLTGVLTHVVSMNSVAVEIALMIGLGVGIDYALFILTRFREIYLENGRNVEEAVIGAMDTAGRAVVFAGITVVIALMGMFALGVSFLYGLAISAALGVLMVLTASVTMLPALLGFFGAKVGQSGWLARLVSRGGSKAATGRPGFWFRWVSRIQRRPAVAAILATAFMLTLTAPALALRLGNSDAGNDPTSSTPRQAYDLLAQGFGAGFNGPLQIVAKLPQSGGAAAVARLRSAVAATPGIAATTPARLSPDGSVAVLSAFPSTSPQSGKTTTLVKHLRADVIPPIEAATGSTVYIGGATAINIDFSTVLSSKLGYFIGLVVLLSALLLLIVFRSLLIPIQAAIMNLLSIGAALGLVTAVFGLGWFPGTSPGPVEAFVPVMMFAIVFGLSMDYEVFLVSRIHEEWARSGDSALAVRDGVAKTGKVITAAATVMIVVFGSFIFGGERVIEEFGVGLAGAVLLDAFIVRSILLPAVFALLGDRTWALPAWLDRRLPHIAIDRPAEADPPVALPVRTAA